MASYINALLRSREDKEVISDAVYGERDRIISIIKKEMHQMRTPGITCYCDRCQDFTNLIIAILKEKR